MLYFINEISGVPCNVKARRRVAVPPTLTAVNQIQYGRSAGSRTNRPCYLRSDASSIPDVLDY